MSWKSRLEAGVSLPVVRTLWLAGLVVLLGLLVIPPAAALAKGAISWTVTDVQPHTPVATSSRLATADPLSARYHSTAPGTNAAMTVGGEITGRVSGDPVGAVVVGLNDSNGNEIDSRCIASGDTYTFSGLPTGSYSVDLYGDWYGCGPFSCFDVESGPRNPVSVTAGETTTLADFVLKNCPSTVTGVVTDAATGAPVPSATVTGYDTSGNVLASAATDSTGAYTLSIPNGYEVSAVKVGFSAGSDYVSQFYNDKPSLQSADLIPFACSKIGSCFADGINAALVETPGQIAGTVSDVVSHAPIQAATVKVYDSVGTAVGSATTDSLGAYTVSGLAPGSYRVGFTAPAHVSQFYNAKASLAAANAVAVAAGSTTSGIDASLSESAGQISGTVTDAVTHSAIGNAAVSVYSSAGTVIASAITGSTGDYTVAGLPPGSYRVAFDAAHHLPQFYNRKSSLAAADPVAVSADSTVPAIDAALAPGRPTLTRLRETQERFRAGNRLARFDRNRTPISTTFSFALDMASTLKLSFIGWRNGRHVRGDCMPQTRANKHKRLCKRAVVYATLSYNASAGPHTLLFEGRVSRSKKLKPGHYKLVIIATNPAGQSQPDQISFTIIS